MQEPQPDKIDLEFQAIALDLAIKAAEDEMVMKPNQLLPKNVLIQRYQKELEEGFAAHRREEKQGSGALSRVLGEIKRENPDFLSQEDMEGIARLAGLKDEKRLTEHLANGGTLQELAQVSDSTMDKLYKAAKQLFDQGLFDDAAGAFTFLCGINPKKYIFWLGLAYSEYRRQRYKEAIDAFTLVCAANPQDPYAFLATSRCFEKLQEPEKALDAIEKGLKAGEQNPDFAQWADTFRQEKVRLLQILHHKGEGV
jgi:type III secretion system low calcium response chaperone LcrH/SycD